MARVPPKKAKKKAPKAKAKTKAKVIRAKKGFTDSTKYIHE